MCNNCERPFQDPASTLEEARARVELGADMLTKNEHDGPAWVKRIDLDRFDIQSGLECIGAQLYGDDWYSFRDAYSQATYVDLCDRGFDSPMGDRFELNLLEQAWREKILAMRAELG